MKLNAREPSASAGYLLLHSFKECGKRRAAGRANFTDPAGESIEMRVETSGSTVLDQPTVGDLELNLGLLPFSDQNKSVVSKAEKLNFIGHRTPPASGFFASNLDEDSFSTQSLSTQESTCSCIVPTLLDGFTPQMFSCSFTLASPPLFGWTANSRLKIGFPSWEPET
jgi:hypothetical protein